jgi:dTDP-4-amino-4,6-dideoxygalactose transaminase
MSKRLYLSPPHMNGMEEKFIREAFEANWISPAGPHIAAFEEELAAQCGVAACSVLSSGTAAIHLGLIMLGVGPGDEVLCSSFTFAGSCNPIVYQGATPVFIDSEPVSWNMDPELLEKAIKERIARGKKPKAIIMVHLYGMPGAIDRIMEISNRYEIPVIEDAAEALGSHYKGKNLGSYGHIGVYSFNGNKIITTSGGGALLSNRKEWADDARFLATQARDPALHYQHSRIGYNYRLSNICAAIGRGQLTVLDERVAQRRKIFDRYTEKMSSTEIGFLKEVPDGFSNRWLTTAVLQSGRVTPTQVIEALEKLNIESRPLWKPMHLQPVFKDAPAYVNGVSEGLFQNGICLPSGSAMTPEQQDLVITSVLETVSKRA